MVALWQIAESKSKTFLLVISCFVLGVGAGSFIGLPNLSVAFSLSVIGIIVLLIIKYWQNLKLRTILLAGLFFVLGFFRFTAALDSIVTSSNLKEYNGKVLNLRGMVVSLPNQGRSRTNYIIELQGVLKERDWTSLKNRIMVSSFNFPEFNYGDVVVFTCTLESSPDSFSWLLKNKVGFGCDARDTMALQESHGGNFFLRKLYDLRKNLLLNIEQILPKSQSGLLAGLLIGETSGFSDELTANFKRTGTMHMVAISGWNISLLTIIFFNFLTATFLRRKQAIWVTQILLFLFVLFVGAGASVLRAGIMGSIILFGKYFGRSSNSLRLLVLAAAIMLVFNPFVLRYDLGFVLSFAATSGLVLFSPLVFEKLKFIPKDFKIRETLSETLSATFATLPFTIFSFGQISVIAPIVNLFVLILVPHAIWTGFLAVILGAVPYLGSVFIFISWLILSSIIGFISFFGNLSFASFNIGIYSILCSIVLGGVVLFCAARSIKKYFVTDL